MNNRNFWRGAVLVAFALVIGFVTAPTVEATPAPGSYDFVQGAQNGTNWTGTITAGPNPPPPAPPTAGLSWPASCPHGAIMWGQPVSVVGNIAKYHYIHGGKTYILSWNTGTQAWLYAQAGPGGAVIPIDNGFASPIGGDDD